MLSPPPPRLPPLPDVGAKVYVAEHGHGARPGKVVRVYAADGIRRVVVALEEMPTRDCWASSVFVTRSDAEKAAE